MENMNDFLSSFDIGELLGVSKEVINNWLREGRIKFSSVGNLRKVRAKHLLEYLKNSGNSPGAMKDFERDIENYLSQKKRYGKQFRAKLRDLKKGRQG